MTKKDFKLFADLLARFHCNYFSNNEVKQVIELLELEITGIFKKDNPNFDIEKWNKYIEKRINTYPLK